MSAMVFQITGVSIVCSTICSGTDQRKHQSFALLACVRGIHRWPVNSPHKRQVMRKMFPFDDVTVSCSDWNKLIVYQYISHNVTGMGDVSVGNATCNLHGTRVAFLPDISNTKALSNILLIYIQCIWQNKTNDLRLHVPLFVVRINKDHTGGHQWDYNNAVTSVSKSLQLIKDWAAPVDIIYKSGALTWLHGRVPG